MFVESRGCQDCQHLSYICLSGIRVVYLCLFTFWHPLSLTAAILTGIRDNMFRDLDNPAPSGPPGSRQQGAGAGGGDQGARHWGGWDRRGWGRWARGQGGWWRRPRPAASQPGEPQRHRGQDLATQPRVHPLLLGLRRCQANEVNQLDKFVARFPRWYNSSDCTTLLTPCC